MSNTGIPAFDTTLHKTHEWLSSVMERLGTDDRHHAYAVSRVILHAVRDLLSLHGLVHLGAQLPTLLRGVYYEGLSLSELPPGERNLKSFLRRVASSHCFPPELQTERHAERAAHAVLDAIAAHLPGGEVESVKRGLPNDIRDFWQTGSSTSRTPRPVR
jgi:uncharacterized protein (DUF2267 family)